MHMFGGWVREVSTNQKTSVSVWSRTWDQLYVKERAFRVTWSGRPHQWRTGKVPSNTWRALLERGMDPFYMDKDHQGLEKSIFGSSSWLSNNGTGLEPLSLSVSLKSYMLRQGSWDKAGLLELSTGTDFQAFQLAVDRYVHWTQKRWHGNVKLQ